jgi:hypothetical protein
MSPPESSGSSRRPGKAAQPQPAVESRHGAPPDINALQRLGEAATFQEGADITYSTRRSPEEIAHSREMEQLRERHRQQMEVRNWWAAILLTTAVALFCGVVYFHSHSADVQKTALAMALSVFTAALGFIAGRASGKSGS